MSDRLSGLICDQCNSLLARPDHAIVSSLVHTDTSHIDVRAESIGYSAAKGCPICTLAEHYLLSKAPETSPETFEPAEIEMSLTRQYDSEQLLLLEGFRHQYLDISCYRRSCAKRLRIDLMRRVDCGKGFYISPGISKHDKAISVNVAPLHPNTGSKAHLATLKHWIDECSYNHPRCRVRDQPNIKSILPSRLINVSIPGQPWLALTSRHHKCKLDYVALSHRWGSLPMPKLLRNNKKALRRTIDPSTLPLVFVEAIDLCHYLGIKYLWIDALCIVQDDENDCAREIKRMGEIYNHAFCNISTVAAAEQPVGLFVEGNALVTSAFPVRIERINHDEDCLAFPRISVEQINYSNLMKRGWILQERLLSRRTILFGEQLSWECTELLANELLPNGVPSYGYTPPSWGEDAPFRLNTLVSFNPPGHQKNECWYQLVSKYTACDLSFEQDIFPAISGLARRYKEVFKDRYLAGLWRSDMVHGLLWCVIRNSETVSDIYSCTYRAPSWSWAAVKAQVSFNWSHRFTTVATVLDASTTPAGDDSFGRVIAGCVKVAGPFRVRQSRQWRPQTGHNSLKQDVNNRTIDIGHEAYDDGHETSHDGEAFLVLVHEKPNQYISVDGPGFWPAMLHGLILEMVPNQKNIYKRVGIFRHAVGRDLFVEERAVFPEFTDFDVNNFGQDVVTII